LSSKIGEYCENLKILQEKIHPKSKLFPVRLLLFATLRFLAKERSNLIYSAYNYASIVAQNEIAEKPQSEPKRTTYCCGLVVFRDTFHTVRFVNVVSCLILAISLCRDFGEMAYGKLKTVP